MIASVLPPSGEAVEQAAEVADEAPARVAQAADKIVATSRLEPVPIELIDVIAQPQDSDDDDDRESAVDAAIESLL